MMPNPSNLTLINPQNGNLAFKIYSFEDNGSFDHVQRHNYFSLIWIKEGKGSATADFNTYSFESKNVFAFSPYQPFMFTPDAGMKGIAIHFHPEFFCIYRHDKEISCNGVLFNNIYRPPFVELDMAAIAIFTSICKQIKTEMQQPAASQYELLVSYLKILLITAARLKIQQHPAAAEAVADHAEPFILQKLKDAIEANFKTLHSPSDYAGLLYISPKALGKLTKAHFNKTLSELINERIIIEAKRELYLTGKSVKEIAYELGYEDEYYFSRFFKVHSAVSPQLYRETVGFAKQEN